MVASLPVHFIRLFGGVAIVGLCKRLDLVFLLHANASVLIENVVNIGNVCRLSGMRTSAANSLLYSTTSYCWSLNRVWSLQFFINYWFE